MKYKLIDEKDGKVFLFLYNETNNTYMEIDLIGGRTMDSVLKDAYIIYSNLDWHRPFEGEITERLEEYIPTFEPVKLIPNFDKLTAKILTQYGTYIEDEVEWQIVGSAARIVKGEIVEDEVEEDTNYLIVCRYGDLEESIERTIYAPKPEPPTEIEILNEKVGMIELTHALALAESYEDLENQKSNLLEMQISSALAIAESYEKLEVERSNLQLNIDAMELNYAMAIAEVYELVSTLGGI